MSIYDINDLNALLAGNPYPGRGIVIGKSADGKHAVFAYFIMGRSENSRNRVFVEKENELVIYPYDESKVEDPSLIIYSPVKRVWNKWVVTNGDQTDTVEAALLAGDSFESALEKREERGRGGERVQPLHLLLRAAERAGTLHPHLQLGR